MREASGYGTTSDTAQMPITIGPAWLEIISWTTAARTDGQFDVTVVVRNQSSQALGRLQVDLLANGALVSTVLVANLIGKTPDRVSPNGTYTLSGVTNPWTG